MNNIAAHMDSSFADPLKWQKLPSLHLPPRYEHSSFVCGGAVHVFGGAQEKGPRSDVWKYDTGRAVATFCQLVLYVDGEVKPCCGRQRGRHRVN